LTPPPPCGINAEKEGRMSELPILFSGLMVKAILAGRKTMTRRVALPRHDDRTPCEHWDGGRVLGQATMIRHCCHGSEGRGSPYGEVGDTLWVREKWATTKGLDHVKPSNLVSGTAIEYAAGGTSLTGVERLQTKGKWRPSIFIPRLASRITLEITGVKVERVQEISEDDAEAEGVGVMRDETLSAKVLFEILWDSINAKRGRGWGVNPWVWAITFKRVI